MAHCCPHSCAFTASRGSQVLSTWACFQAASGISTCSAIKPWKAMNLGMSSCLHQHRGGGEMVSSGYIFCRAGTFTPLSLSQITAGANRTVKPWPQIIVGSVPGKAWSPCQNFGGRTFLLPGKPVFPGKEINTGALTVKMHPLPVLPPNEFQPKLIAPESAQAAAACLLPELIETPENEICP